VWGAESLGRSQKSDWVCERVVRKKEEKEKSAKDNPKDGEKNSKEKEEKTKEEEKDKSRDEERSKSPTHERYILHRDFFAS
jgi:hypothetical protein